MKWVYSKAEFDVYQTDDGYVLHNNSIENFAHSHLENLKTCKYLIDLSLRKKIPHDLPRYLIISLIRINDDEIYVRKLNELLSSKKKKQNYYNANKGVRKNESRRNGNRVR